MLMEELLLEENMRPTTLLEDNTGAIHLVENAIVESKTKHIDIRWHYIHKMQEARRIWTIFVRLENNYIDIMTKNATEKVHKDLRLGIQRGRMLYIYNTAIREDIVDSSQSRIFMSDVDRPNDISAGQDTKYKKTDVYAEQDWKHIEKCLKDKIELC